MCSNGNAVGGHASDMPGVVEHGKEVMRSRSTDWVAAEGNSSRSDVKGNLTASCAVEFVQAG